MLSVYIVDEMGETTTRSEISWKFRISLKGI